MWINVEYKEKLELGQEIRVKFTGHVAKISNIVDKDKNGEDLHCLCYHIHPRDPKDPGGHWFFSHDFEKKN